MVRLLGDGKRAADPENLVCVAIKSLSCRGFGEAPQALFMCFPQVPSPQSHYIFSFKIMVWGAALGMH